VLENPYVGPKAYTENESARFFGRAMETRELASLVIARRAVLLYAQSGSGKTSLVQASLIPQLKRRKRVEIFPIARVTGGADPGNILAGANVYVKNALANLFPGAAQGRSLAEAFSGVLGAKDGAQPQPHLLIFDQFEEIFTFHPELTEQRAAFFEQLGECLSTYPQLSLLLSMREDYLADLDAIAALLPDRMRTRMRLERLDVENAVEAIRQPAAIAGTPFAPGAAEELVDNLRRIRTGAAEGNGFALGQYVEPVQMQIVCRQLWSRLTADSARTKVEIDGDDIAKYASVDDALTQFYRDSLAKARESGVTERTLRRWFGERLITPGGTRGMAFRGEKETEGLPNAAVDILRDCYIIRADLRGGTTWYELAHDRLVDPVKEDNLAWLAGYYNPVAAALERSPDTLLSGTGLEEGRQFAKEHPLELNEGEKQFLEKSEQEAKKAAMRRKRSLRIAVAVGAALLILTCVAGVLAWRATVAERRANVALKAEKKAKKERLEDDVNYAWAVLSPSHCTPESAGAEVVGLRVLYCEISPITDIRHLERLSGMQIFLPGGPHGNKPNWNSNKFGHYNPQFVQWAADNLVPPKTATTQAVYDEYMELDARIFLIAYATLQKNPQELAEMAQVYKSGQPLPQVEEGRPPHQYPVSWLEGRFFNSGIDDDPDIKPLPPPQWLGKGAVSQTNAYVYCTAMGFWARREADGTRTDFYQLLTNMLKVYDPGFERRRAP
jgi:Novel STAND NTPase 1